MDRDERRDLAEAFAGPRWLRKATVVVLSIATPVFKVGRVIIVLQAVGGIVAILVGVATLHAVRVIMGFGQLLLAALVFGIDGGTRETVSEAAGPEGGFILRTHRRRTWRDRRGWRAIVALLSGDRVWAVTVRRRQDDPFGRVVAEQTVAKQKDAAPIQREFRRRIEGGEPLSPTAGSPS